jgi:hypothetical protein
MTCRACDLLARLAVNVLLLLDETGNVLTGGAPDETISQRLARARRDGKGKVKSFASFSCKILTYVGYLFGAKQDHCTWALDSAGGSAGGEIIPLSPGGPEEIL